MRATSKCPHCNKIAEVVSEKTIPSMKRIRLTFKCGHTVLEKLVAVPSGRDDKWNDFFKFQQENIEFIERANFKALDADEMGLGKTIVACGLLRYNFPTLTPVIIICKASLIYNWMREYCKWTLADCNLKSDPINIPFPVMHGDCAPLEGFNTYILSMDLLSKPKIQEWIQNTPFKTLIIDESHHFKSVVSKRTSALNLCTKHIPFRICLSGTPILNNAVEYWPTLNIIRPEHFPSRARFIQRYIEYDERTKRFLGIHKYMRDDFFRMTSQYVIRHEKKDVLKDLPPMRCNSQVIQSFDRAFASAYNAELDKLDNILLGQRSDFEKKAGFMDVLAAMSRLRHITGLAKITPAYEYILEFLESTPKESKICIGIHHKDVAFYLGELLKEYHPIMISGVDSPEAKQDKENQFRSLENRIAICNILAVGEGRNFQFCANALVLERQWNRAKEAQFEGRFQRPMKCDKCDKALIKVSPQDGVPYYQCPKCNETSDIIPIQIDYLLAANTIDEFFENLVKLKGKVIDSTMSWEFETDYASIYQLAQEVVRSRMKAGI